MKQEARSKLKQARESKKLRGKRKVEARRNRRGHSMRKKKERISLYGKFIPFLGFRV